MMRRNENSRCREMMKDDLMKVYREVVKKYECQNNLEAFEMVIKSPAPRFYIDPRRAHQRIAPMLRGDRSQIEHLSPLRQEMYEALFDVVMRLWQKTSYWDKKLYYVLKFAVLEPAPRFYITSKRMCQIWNERSNKRRKEELS